MDPQQGIVWTPQDCHYQRIRLAKLLLNSSNKDLSRMFHSRLSDYAFQGTLYGLVLAGCFVALSWTRYKVIKVHKPGALAVFICGGALGWSTGTSMGTERAIQDIGRIAEDPSLDKLRSEILENCKAKLK